MSVPPSDTESNHEDIFMPRDIFDLVDRGLVLPGATGTRYIHEDVLIASGYKQNENPETIDYPFVKIPTKLISLATIEYVGFTLPKAVELWSLWMDSPFNTAEFMASQEHENLPTKIFLRLLTTPFDIPLRVGYQDVARWIPCGKRSSTNEMLYQEIREFFYTSSLALADSTITGSPMDTLSLDTQIWRVCLSHFGLDEAMQERIIDPMYTDLRRTTSCASLAKLAVQTRFGKLQMLQKASRERAADLSRGSPTVPDQGDGHLPSKTDGHGN